MTCLEQIAKRHRALHIDVRQMQGDIEYLLNEIKWLNREWTKDSDEVLRLRALLKKAPAESRP